MNRLAMLFLAVLALSTVENKSHAYAICLADQANDYDRNFCIRHYGLELWLTSTTLLGPLALIADGEIDFTHPEARELVLAQAEAIASGNETAINHSDNTVRVLASVYGVDERKLAQAIKTLGDDGREITRESIAEALK